MSAREVWSRWRERRQRRREVGQAIRNGTLSQFHRERHGSFVADVEFHRSEELRPDRLGPVESDLEGERDSWRPKRTLGPLP